MLFAAALVIALASPTPPPEPNHVTLDLSGQWLKTSSNGWENAKGSSTQAMFRYEFQASPSTRFNNTLHWEHLASTWDFRAGSSLFTAPFNYTLYDDEFSLELGRPEAPFGVGVGYFNYSPIFDGETRYTEQGFGVGVDQWTNYYLPRSFYYSLWYYPNLTPSVAAEGGYSIVRAELGVNLRPNLTSPWNLKIGVQNENWFSKATPDSNLWIIGPYVGLSYWH